MSSERNIIKEGYLIKSPPQHKLMAQWHKRYFVLWSSRLMEYYTSHEKKPTDYRKTIDLKNCEDMIAPLPIPSKGFVIKLSVKNDEKKRDYFFECFSESDMNGWVKCLASVCGFTPVDEEEAEVTTNDTHLVNQVAPIKRPALRPPIPPPKPSSSIASVDDDQAMYEEIITQGASSIDDASDSDDDSVDTSERHYEELSLDESALDHLNKCPPPLWNPSANPPPLPSANPPRKWSKSLERHSSFEFIESNEIPRNSTPPVPPTKPPHGSLGDDFEIQKRPLPALPPANRPVSDSRIPVRKESPANQKPGGSYRGRSKKAMPPPPKPSKPSKFGSSDNLLSHSTPAGMLRGMGMRVDINNDPKFKGKLKERRQEIYSGTNDRFQKSQSWHEDSGGQMPYEEINYTGDGNDLQINVPQLNPSVRFGADENDEGYIDCELSEDGTPQDYLDFETASKLVNEDIPLPLPTRDGENHGERLRRDFVSKPPLPIPPRDLIRGQKKTHSPKVNPKPPSPLKKPSKTVKDHKMPPSLKRSTSTGEIPSGRTSPGCPTSSPPPLPSREVLRTHATSSIPPPLPHRDVRTVQIEANEGEESPPPVPRRHPQASDKFRATSPTPASTSIATSRTPSPDNILPLPPRAKSPANLSPSLPPRNNAPPLPSRASNRDALPPPPPNRSVSEPFPRHGHPVLPPSKLAPITPDNDENNHYCFAEVEEQQQEEQPIFEPVQFGRRSPTSEIINELSSKNNQPPLPSRGKPQQQRKSVPDLPSRKETPPLPSNKPPRDRTKPCPPPVANKPTSQVTASKKPPLAQKPKPGAGVPKPRIVAAASNSETAHHHQQHHQRMRVIPPKPAIKAKPPPPPKPVPGTA